MHYYSTNDNNLRISFRQAVLSGIAPDGGLYMPESIPELPAGLLDRMPQMTLADIAVEVIRPFVQPMSESDLEKITRNSISFPAPLTEVSGNLDILELWHGPTLAFKDFGARFLAHMLTHILEQERKEILVLVATSGDTGSAVAEGFYGMPGITVGLLYPSGKVSWIQEKQLTTVGGNVHAFEIDGSFDDCQRLVKEAFADQELSRQFYLTSANSINICRLLPQMFYYFYAYSRKHHDRSEPVFCVPSGNFGNLTAGLIAWKMGLPAAGFIAAVNANRVFESYIRTGEFIPVKAVPTLSNAMDVGDPSNFSRISDIFNRDVAAMRRCISSYSIDDGKTKEGIREMWRKYGYLIDPHGAVGYEALKLHQAQQSAGQSFILLETAHPAKFKDIVEQAVDVTISMPGHLAQVLKKEKKSVRVNPSYPEFKKQLIKTM
jgi:threonine synthase